MIITAVAASFSHEGEATTASETLARDFTWMMLSLLSKWQLFLCFKLLSQAARMPSSGSWVSAVWDMGVGGSFRWAVDQLRVWGQVIQRT